MASSFFRNGMAKWAFFVVALFVIWFGGWFVFAHWADGKIGDAVAKLNTKGIAIECPDRTIIGFPFRAGIRCQSLTIDDQLHGFSLKAGAVRSAAQIYAPRKNIIELDGPFTFENYAVSVNANWQLMRTYMEAKGRGFELLSTNYEQLNGEINGQNFSIESGQIHARPKPVDQASLDVAGQTNKLSIQIGGDELAFDIAGDVGFQNGYQHFVVDRKGIDQWLSDGAAIDIRGFSLKPTSGQGKILLEGPLKVETDGTLTGKIKLGVEDADALARWATQINPEFGPVAAGIGQAIALLGKDDVIGGENMRVISLKVERGDARIGFLGIGKLPPLFSAN